MCCQFSTSPPLALAACPTISLILIFLHAYFFEQGSGDPRPFAPNKPASISVEDIAKVECPTSTTHRYSQLDGMAKILIDIAKHNPPIYQRTVLQLQSMITQAKVDADGADLALTGIQASSVPLAPSVREKSRNKNKSTTNLANRNRAKKTNNTAKTNDSAKGKCLTCRARGVVPEDNHRSNSSNCPFFAASPAPALEAATAPASGGVSDDSAGLDGATAAAAGSPADQIINVDSTSLDGATAAAGGSSTDQAIDVDNSDSDSDDDAVVLADLARDPTKWLKVDAVSDFGEMTDVPSDGNCGYWAVDAALRNAGVSVFPNGRPPKPITCIRKAVYDDIDESRAEYFGTGRREDDQVEHLKITCYYVNNKKKKLPFWVEYSLNKGGAEGRYKGIFAAKDLEPFINNALLGVTWQDKWDFDRKGCLTKVKFFMSVQKHLPAVSKLYKTSIICYTDKHDGLPNGATFACIYDKSSGVVSIYDIKGIRKPPPSIPIPCIYKCSSAHFNWLKIKN